MADIENFKSDVLPYDFVKENEVIVSETEHGYLALSPYQLTITLYHEIQRYLKSDFKFEICSSDKFNELLTNSFSSTNHNNDISDECAIRSPETWKGSFVDIADVVSV